MTYCILYVWGQVCVLEMQLVDNLTQEVITSQLASTGILRLGCHWPHLTTKTHELKCKSTLELIKLHTLTHKYMYVFICVQYIKKRCEYCVNTDCFQWYLY